MKHQQTTTHTCHPRRGRQPASRTTPNKTPASILTVGGFRVILSSTRAPYRLGRRLGLAKAARRLLLCAYSIVHVCAKVNTCSLLFATLTQKSRPGWNDRGGCYTWLSVLALYLAASSLAMSVRDSGAVGQPSHWLVSWCSVAKSASSISTSNSWAAF